MKLKNKIVPTQVIDPAQQKKMVLSAILDSKPSESQKVVLYAPEGWGKTTWASKSENPIFISTEDGIKNIKVKKFPEPEMWQDIFDAIDALRSGDHDYKNLVIDTADWTEHLCQKFLLERDKKTSIEDYGYGKGYVIAFEEWKKLLSSADKLRKEKGMSVIFLAHSTIKTFNNPSGENFDRWEMKTDRRISALLKEWADCVLFGNYDIAVDIQKGQSKGKGFGGDRVIYANHSPAWDAKNRYGITEPISSEYSDFIKEVKKCN